MEIPVNFKGVIWCGYTLYGEGRMEVLRSLREHGKKDLRCCFVIGTMDKDNLTLVKDMRGIAEDIGWGEGRIKVVAVEGGGDSVFDIKGKGEETIVEKAGGEIEDFIRGV